MVLTRSERIVIVIVIPRLQQHLNFVTCTNNTIDSEIWISLQSFDSSAALIIALHLLFEEAPCAKLLAALSASIDTNTAVAQEIHRLGKHSADVVVTLWPDLHV